MADYGIGRNPRLKGPIVHFARLSEAAETLHAGYALCFAGARWRDPEKPTRTREADQLVAGDWAYVTCRSCHRMREAHNKREARAEATIPASDPPAAEEGGC